MGQRGFQNSFSGGEISPAFWGRIDDPKYQAGLALCRNFLVNPAGYVENRPGTTFVRKGRNAFDSIKLIPFTYSTTQTMVLEAGSGYLRFHTQGAAVLASAQSAFQGGTTVSSITIGTPCQVFCSGTLAVGVQVAFFTTGTLPTGINSGQTYYIIQNTGGYYYISATKGGGAVSTSGSQSGVHTMVPTFVQGDLVSNSGLNYYCIATVANVAPPNTTYWYPQPATGEYEIPAPWVGGDCMQLGYTQSSDVMTLTHPGYQVYELRRYGAYNWQLVPVSFQSNQVPPTGVTAVATGGTGTTYKYVVTSLGTLNTDESLQSTLATCSGNLFVTGAYNTVTWSPSPTANRYFVYRFQGGIYAFVGIADSSCTFIDLNIAADVTRGPPNGSNPFSGALNYPTAVSYFEQRRVFAGTLTAPQTVWATKSGTESNMNYALPVRDDDSIQFRVVSREAQTVRHIVPLINMLLLTSGGEWRISSSSGGPLTPSNINAQPQSYVGSSFVQPVTVGNSCLFAAARGGHVYDMTYAYQSGGFVTQDLTLRASHLFDNYDIVDMAVTKAPYTVVWAVSSIGRLLGLTYAQGQAVAGWHWHDTGNPVTLGTGRTDTITSICAVAEGARDALYMVVNRRINFVSVNYIERMAYRGQYAGFDDTGTDTRNSLFVDCAVNTYTNGSGVITGLLYLEGRTVNVLADGIVQPQQVVTGGQITLDAAYGNVHVGLPITSDLKTLPAVYNVPGYGQGRAKNVNKVWIHVQNALGIMAGPSFNNLTPFKGRTTEPYGRPPGQITDADGSYTDLGLFQSWPNSALSTEVELVLSPQWGQYGQVCIRHTEPTSLTILAIESDVAVGG